MKRSYARQLALKLISGLVFLLVAAGLMTAPASSDPGRERPPPD